MNPTTEHLYSWQCFAKYINVLYPFLLSPPRLSCNGMLLIRDRSQIFVCCQSLWIEKNRKIIWMKKVAFQWIPFFLFSSCFFIYARITKEHISISLIQLKGKGKEVGMEWVRKHDPLDCMSMTDSMHNTLHSR